MPSSVIRHFCYHPAERRLEILFQTGRRYSYLEVPQDIFAAMKTAFSKGEFFNAHIRDRFRFIRERERNSASTCEEL
jgi:lysyl-tRNA synthetase class 2